MAVLTDINSDFGLDGAPFLVKAENALMNLIKNLFRTNTGSDRFDFIEFGLGIERKLQEPSSPSGANEIFMMIQNALKYYLSEVTLDLSRSRVTVADEDLGSYELLLILNGDSFNFYI